MNKKIGNEFEKRVVKKLNDNGYWVHFIAPDARGAQPFDIIAVRGGIAMAIDCKTCAEGVIRYSRLEDNQVMAFEKWLACKNAMPQIACEYKGEIFLVPYNKLRDEWSVKLCREKIKSL